MPSRRNRSGKKCKRGGNLFDYFTQTTTEQKIKKALDDAKAEILATPELIAKFIKTKDSINNALTAFNNENSIQGETNTVDTTTDGANSPSPPNVIPGPTGPTTTTVGGKNKSMKGGRNKRTRKTKRRR